MSDNFASIWLSCRNESNVKHAARMSYCELNWEHASFPIVFSCVCSQGRKYYRGKQLDVLSTTDKMSQVVPDSTLL